MKDNKAQVEAAREECKRQVAGLNLATLKDVSQKQWDEASNAVSRAINHLAALASAPPAPAASEPVAAHSLLRAPVKNISKMIPGGCYCPPDRCEAPVIMGRQTPCLRRNEEATPQPPAASSDALDGKEQFEVYAFNMGYRDFEPDQDGNDGYRNPHIQSKWDFWKASRAAIKGEHS